MAYQVTHEHYNATPTVTYLSAENSYPLASTKLYCLMTQACKLGDGTSEAPTLSVHHNHKTCWSTYSSRSQKIRDQKRSE